MSSGIDPSAADTSNLPRSWPAFAVAGTVLVAFGAGVLWATQGGAVFYEMITSNIAACF